MEAALKRRVSAPVAVISAIAAWRRPRTLYALWRGWLIIVGVTLGIFIAVAPLLRFAGFLVFALLAAGAQAWRYWRISAPTQRQQAKRAVLGLSVALASYLVLTFGYPLISAADPTLARFSPTALKTLTSLTFPLVPISLAIAVLRHRLYNVDILINRALVYRSLTASLAVLYLASVLGLQVVVVALTRQDHPSALVIVESTLLIAALFQPLRRRLQRSIDRRFYRRKYGARATIAAFAANTGHELNLRDLRQRLLDVVQDTMQPTHLCHCGCASQTRAGETSRTADRWCATPLSCILR